MNRERLASIVRKEFVQMRRDRATLALMLGIPIMQLAIFGYAIRLDVRDLATVVYDASRTRHSRELVERFAATGNFRIAGAVPSYAAAEQRLQAGKAYAAIIVPPDYARRLERGAPTTVQVLVDATSPTISQNALAAAQLVGQRVSLARLDRGGTPPRQERPPLEVRVRPLYNPALSSPLFIVPGVIGMILSNILIIITALSIVREREFGTLEQLIVTPLTRTEIMVGKIAPYVLVGFIQLTAVLLVGATLFRVPVRGSLWLVYVASAAFIVASLGLGLLISTLARGQAQAMQTSFFLLLPNVLLSGFMFPREGMPPAAREIGLILPLTHFLVAMRGIVLKGVGLAELWPQLAALVGFAALFLAFSALRFHKQLE